MPAESDGPSFRFTYRPLLSCCREDLLNDFIDIRRIRHTMLSDSVSILLGEKGKHPIVEILRSRGRCRRLRGYRCGRR